VTKGQWADLSDAQIAKRLSRILEVVFAEDATVGLGATPAALGEVAEDAYVALEIETKHTHPAENVLQYWPWLERSRRRLVLVHVIAPDARKRHASRTDLTKWLGAMMERVLPGRFTYCRLDLGTDDEPSQLEAAVEAVTQLRNTDRSRSLAPGL